jgi:hypothetical protein
MDVRIIEQVYFYKEGSAKQANDIAAKTIQGEKRLLRRVLGDVDMTVDIETTVKATKPEPQEPSVTQMAGYYRGPGIEREKPQEPSATQMAGYYRGPGIEREKPQEPSATQMAGYYREPRVERDEPQTLSATQMAGYSRGSYEEGGKDKSSLEEYWSDNPTSVPSYMDPTYSPNNIPYISHFPSMLSSDKDFNITSSYYSGRDKINYFFGESFQIVSFTSTTTTSIVETIGNKGKLLNWDIYRSDIISKGYLDLFNAIKVSPKTDYGLDITTPITHGRLKTDGLGFEVRAGATINDKTHGFIVSADLNENVSIGGYSMVEVDGSITQKDVTFNISAPLLATAAIVVGLEYLGFNTSQLAPAIFR